MNKRITSAFREFILILILFISLPSFILAQALYPVTAILDVQGPYSPVFSTFSDPSNQAFRPNKMALRLRLNDLNEASLDVRLKWEISGPGIEFQTNDDFLGGIANLISGQYITLDNAALTPYFDLFGSSGISDEFVTGTGGYLPEGSYSFCVTAFELTKGQQVSNTTCREIYIEEYEPPFLNNPSGPITPTFPQNLQISWTPRHFGVFPVIYNVKIWETFEGLTPDQVVSSQMPYITLDVNQVTQTFLNSQNGLLTPGRSYLAQVQIRDGVNGPFGMPSVIFKNNGNSEVLAFTYGAADPEGVCTAPLDFKSELDDQQNVVLFWQESDPTLAPTVGRSAQVAYQIKYREVGVTEWQIKETSVRSLLMPGLRQGETYEIELYKVCLNGLTRGGALKVLVPKRNKARTLPDCGEEMDISGMSEVPLERLAVNDTIFASGTEVIVQEVAGSGGVFTGKGFIRLPLLSTIKIAVEFDAISVNEDFELTAGEIRTVYNPLAGNVANINFGSDNLTDFPTLEYQDSFKIISLTADGTLIYLDGKEMLVNGVYVKGKGLNEFVFSGERFDVFEEYEKFDSLGPVRVKFAASGNQRYGFDGYKPALDKEYEKYFDLPVSYKSVAEGAFDEVEVFVEGGLEEGDTILFVDELTKAELQFSPKGVSTKYRVNAMGPGRPSAIIAYVINKGVAGKLNIYSTPITKVPIKIVNVNGVSGNSAGVESTINKIFGPGLFKVEVVGQDDFDYVEKEDGIINVENHFLNAYSPDMKKLADEYFKTKGQLDETFYLFISDKLEANTQGLMPQGYAAGFISSTASAQVYAHELAHGIFNFDHSWLMYGLDSMKTQNLMDYSGGTELWYRQWRQMVSPGFPKGWRKDEKDGSQLSAGNLDYQCIKGSALAKLIDAGLTFFDFGGNPVELKTEEQPYAFVSPSEGSTYEGRIGIIRKGDKIYGPSIDFKEVDKVKTPIWTGVYANFNFSSDTISLKKSDKTAVKVIIDKEGLLLAGDLRIEHSTENCPISSENKEGISDGSILNDLEIFKILTVGQTLNESEKQKVYDFIQYVKSLIAGRTAFFVEYNADQKLYAQQPQDNAFWEFLRDKKLTTQTEFDKVFKSYDRSGKDFDKIVSNVDLWQNIGESYNSNSFDYASYVFIHPSKTNEWVDFFTNCNEIASENLIELSFANNINRFLNNPYDAASDKQLELKEIATVTLANLGAFQLFKYSIKDLIYRKYLLSSQMLSYVQDMESFGQAVPLTESGNYEQQLAKWSTDRPIELMVSYFAEALIFAGPGSNLLKGPRSARISKFKSFEYRLRLATNKAKKSKIFNDLDDFSSEPLGQDGLKIFLKNSVENGGHALIKTKSGEYEDIHFDGPVKRPDKFQNNVEAEAAIIEAPQLVTNLSSFKSVSSAQILVPEGSASPSFENLSSLKYTPKTVTSYSFQSNLKPELIILNLAQNEKVVIYCSERVLKELIKENDKKNNCEICPDRKPARSDIVCKELQELQKVTGNKTAVQKLCKSSLNDIELSSVIQKLNTIPITRNQFLIDLETECSNNLSLCINVNSLKPAIIDAWQIVFDARGTNKYKLDYNLLKQIVTMKDPSNSNMYQTLGGDGVLKDLLLKNKTAPCNTCTNSQTKQKFMDSYLKDVENFVITYGKNTGGNNSNAVFSSGITSGNPGHVNGAIFMLSVLPTGITQFENKLNCGAEADARINNKIIEFKSWAARDGETDEEDEEQKYDRTKSSFWNFERGYQSYSQFLCYLQTISSLEDLEYVFDAKKASEADVLKAFQGLYQNKKDEIFEVFWANPALRDNSFPAANYPAGIDLLEYKALAKEDFYDLVKSLNAQIHPKIRVI